MPANVWIGKDTDDDGIPNDPWFYDDFDDSKSKITMPLGFCPGKKELNFVFAKSKDKLQNATEGCKGQWGLVLKEWETITAVRQIHNFIWIINENYV